MREAARSELLTVDEYGVSVTERGTRHGCFQRTLARDGHVTHNPTGWVLFSEHHVA